MLVMQTLESERNMMKQRLLERIDQIIEQANRVKSTESSSDGWRFVDSAEMRGLRTAALSFIERVYGKEHTHYIEFSKHTDGCHPTDAEAALSMLTAIRSEIEGNWLFTIRELVTAEVFSDFLSMSEYLLSEGYKDSAAVIIGSTLEEHLWQLAQSNSIDVFNQFKNKKRPKKASILNSELCKAGVYSQLDQKAITTWLALRNHAAHGKYDQYTEDQVLNLMNGVTEFFRRVRI